MTAFDDLFETHRRFLTRLAYRMLGSVSDAEDIVQEAWLRWRDVPQEEVEAPRAYLARTVTRLCLDQMKSARSKREFYVGAWLPEPLVEEIGAAQADVDTQLDAPIAQGGTNLSGGQRQRLAIARALVKRPEIHIFDDSFSALDLRTDAALRRALDTRLPNATRIVVAQRVSTIRHADQIVVLDHGRMVGLGTHDRLVETCETYAEIVESQLAAEAAA